MGVSKDNLFVKSDGWKKLSRYPMQIISRIKEATPLALQQVVNQALEDAITRREYTDRSGNLVSSTGGAIGYDGKEIFATGFSKTTGPELQEGQTVSGDQIGREYAREIVEEKSADDVYAATIVAGMPYAQYVEHKGFNVLKASQQLLEQNMGEAMEDILKEAGLK